MRDGDYKKPNVICPGAQKSATTALHNLLGQHHNICVSRPKEPHFFDIYENFKQGVDAYVQEYYSHLSDEDIRVDVTPRYLYVPGVAKRIRSVLGDDIKFVVILRNPLDRAYSQYCMHRGTGLEDKSFRAAIKNEVEKRQTKDEEQLKKLDKNGDIRSYVGRGCYGKQIKRYLKHFDRSSFYFILFERFTESTSGHMRRLFNFLKVDTEVSINYDVDKNEASKSFIKTIDRIQRSATLRKIGKCIIPNTSLRKRVKKEINNLNTIKQTKTPFGQGAKEILVDYYTEDVDKLEKLTGLDVSIWNINR